MDFFFVSDLFRSHDSHISLSHEECRCCSNNHVLYKRILCNKISDNIEGIVKYLLTKKYSYSVIQQELLEMSLNVSRSAISRIANQMGKQHQACLLNNQKPKFYRRRHVATPTVIRRITSYINKESPPTISLTAARCHISVGTTFRIIRDVIHAK